METSEPEDKVPNIDVGNFMLEEYKTMAAAFFDLSDQKSKMFKFYLTIVTIPITLIAAIFSLEKIYLFQLPFFVALFMVIVSFTGYLMTLIIIDIRFECILYAKTVNLTRRYFTSITKSIDLTNYLVLPIVDSFPRFYESPFGKDALSFTATFLEVILMAILNSAYLFLGMKDGILPIYFSESQSLSYGFFLGILFFIFHILSYRYLAMKQDNIFPVKYIE